MIDTDKYEGHTPAPWEFTDFDPLHLWGESPIISGGEGYSQNEADWKLIADAPLLLAEVKRLRERVKTEKNLKLWEKSEVKRLREKNETFYQSLGPFLRACWKNGGMIE